MQVLYKSCRDLQQKSIVPTHLPYVVSLVRFYETDSAIYLQLQHAAGGRLWSYVGAYLNQCIDAAANVHVEPQRPADDISGGKKRRQRKSGDSGSTSLECRTDGDEAVAGRTESGDLKSKLSLSDVDSTDDACDPADRKFSVASSSVDCLSHGFSDVLRSANPELSYFRIDSGDSSEIVSRHESTSSTECGFCPIHSAAMLSAGGLCRVCSESATPRPDKESGSPDEMSIYDKCCSEHAIDCTDKTSCHSAASVPDELTAHRQTSSDDSRLQNSRSALTQERSFDSCDRHRRRRNLSSAFGELDLAESAAGTNAAQLTRPLVHLPESCVRQWAAEMVVAISRLHSIGIICRQVCLL